MDSLPEVDAFYARAQAGDTSARNQLWQCHFRLVYHVAKRFYRSDGFLEWGDLVQQGSLGLLHAIQRFKPLKRFHGQRVAFSTYATYWIAHMIRRELQKRGRTIYLPIYLQEELMHWKQELQGLRACLRKRSTDEIQRLSCAEQPIYSLDVNPTEGQEESPLRSSLYYLGTWDSNDQELIQQEVGRAIRQLVQELPAREGYIVQQRFGRDEGVPIQTLAAKMRISKQRVRVLEKNALRRLRHAAQRRPELQV